MSAASAPLESPTLDEKANKRLIDSILPLFTAITPVLPVLLTAATFIVTFLFQLQQQRVQTVANEDSEWRKALGQIDEKDPSGVIRGAYEMESFLNTAHGAQAQEVAATLLPKVDNEFAFDVLLFDLLPRITQGNQNQVISINALLTLKLEELYDDALSTTKKQLPEDRSFKSFLKHPALFFDETRDGQDKLHETLTKTWELDSVSNGLSAMWSGQYGIQHPVPQGEELANLVFWNNDFSSVNFKDVSMKDVQFYGNCKVDRASLPKNVKSDCDK